MPVDKAGGCWRLRKAIKWWREKEEGTQVPGGERVWVFFLAPGQGNCALKSQQWEWVEWDAPEGKCLLPLIGSSCGSWTLQRGRKFGVSMVWEVTLDDFLPPRPHGIGTVFQLPQTSKTSRGSGKVSEHPSKSTWPCCPWEGSTDSITGGAPSSQTLSAHSLPAPQSDLGDSSFQAEKWSLGDLRSHLILRSPGRLTVV